MLLGAGFSSTVQKHSIRVGFRDLAHAVSETDPIGTNSPYFFGKHLQRSKSLLAISQPVHVGQSQVLAMLIQSVPMLQTELLFF